MDGEIVDPLLGLFDQRVAEDLPGQVLGNAADLFQRLVDRHGADRHRGVADDPFADVVDVAPVERSITVSAPQRIDQTILSTSSATSLVTAELPILALILTRKLRPIAIGSVSRWLMLVGMITRPRATSSRTNSGVIVAAAAAASGALLAGLLAGHSKSVWVLCAASLPLSAMPSSNAATACSSRPRRGCRACSAIRTRSAPDAALAAPAALWLASSAAARRRVAGCGTLALLVLGLALASRAAACSPR